MDPETVSTRNVVYQDLGNNQVVKVRIPYCSPFQAYDAKTQGTSALTARRSIPILFATDFTTIVNALTGNVDSKNVIVHGWLENVEVTVPSFQAQSATENFKMSTLQAPKLSSVMSMGANLLQKASAVTAALGYSKPTGVATQGIGTVPQSHFEGQDNVFKLAVDPHCKLNPNEVDKVDVHNPMDLGAFTKREGLISRGIMNPNTNIMIPVTPGVFIENGTTQYFTPLAYAAMAFQWWRGTLRYRIKFVASKYHRSAARVAWLPGNRNDPSTVPVNVASMCTQNVFVDINGDTEIIFDVKWGTNQPYLPVVAMNPNDHQYPQERNVINGTLAIYLLDVQAPVTTAYMKCLVWVSALDDFELAVPTLTNLRMWSSKPMAGEEAETALATTSQGYVPEFVRTDLSYFGAEIYPEYVGYSDLATAGPALLAEDPSEKDVVLESDVTSLSHVVHFVANEDQNPPSAERYMGEKVTNLSQLLKRHIPTYAFLFDGTGANSRTVSVPAYPWQDAAGVRKSSTVPVPFNPGQRPTYIRWFSRAYRGYRGSMRMNAYLRWPTKNAEMTGPSGQGKLMCRRSICDPFVNAPEAMGIYDNPFNAGSGTGFETSFFERGQPCQVEYPWQLPFDWWPANEDNWFPRFQPCFLMTLIDVKQYMWMWTSHAIGDDFTFVQWLGIPPMTYVQNEHWTNTPDLRSAPDRPYQIP